MKLSISKLVSIIALATLFLMASPTPIQAQCPMCKMAAESNLNEGGTAGEGLNKGILMLFSMPYLLVGGVAFVWYKNRIDEDDDYEGYDFSKN